MELNAVRSALSGRRLGHTIEHHAVIGSTNDRAAELVREGGAEGVVVLAESQTAGRGRMGRRWEDRAGKSLLFSVVLRPEFDVEHWPLIGLAAGASCARAIREMTGIEVRTKWPNDLVVAPERAEGQTRALLKLGGILLEAGAGFAILGVGINVLEAPSVCAGSGGLMATSLAEQGACSVSRGELLVAVLGRFEGAYELMGSAEGRARVIASCRELDMTIGTAVTLSGAGELVSGSVQDIDATGALVLDTGRGVRRFLAGEVTLRSVMSHPRAGES